MEGPERIDKVLALQATNTGLTPSISYDLPKALIRGIPDCKSKP